MNPKLPASVETPKFDARAEVIDATRFGLATLAASVIVPGAAMLIPAAYGVKKMVQAFES